MTVDAAIEKAKEGGWDSARMEFIGPTEIISDIEEKAFLDPSFWQSLGKALGWGHIYCTSCAKPGEHRSNNGCDEDGWPWKKCCERQHMDYRKAPIMYWHRLIDHLAGGKAAEEFFKELN